MHVTVSLPECGKSGPPKSFTCCGFCAWPWKAPCSGPQILLGRSHAARLRYPPAVPSERVEDVCDCSRLSIRKLFPELPKPGKAGGEPAILLPLQLWTETILFTQWPEHSSSLFSSHSSVTLNSPLIPSWVTRPTSLNYEENKSPLLFLFLACTLQTGLCCDWLRGFNVLLNSDKTGVLSRVAEGGSGSFIMSTSLLNDRHQRQWTAGQSLTCTKQSSPVVNSFLFSPASLRALLCLIQTTQQFICNVLFLVFQKHYSVRVFLKCMIQK